MKIYDLPKDIKVYKSGSPNQWKALELMDILPIDSFISKKTNRLIKIYIWTDVITEFLVQWTNNKPEKGVK